MELSQCVCVKWEQLDTRMRREWMISYGFYRNQILIIKLVSDTRHKNVHVCALPKAVLVYTSHHETLLNYKFNPRSLEPLQKFISKTRALRKSLRILDSPDYEAIWGDLSQTLISPCHLVQAYGNDIRLYIKLL